MRILPAIDLLVGKVVRLRRGDYDDVTVYSDDPISFAKSFAVSGARDLHIVDLSGARSGLSAQYDLIEKIITNSSLSVEVGGGIRTLDSVKRYIEAGAARVILGTAAIEDEALLESAVSLYGERIAVGVDVKEGRVAIRGWRDLSDQDGFRFCEKMKQRGVSTLIVTDISRDGMLGGSNIELYKKLSAELDVKIIASGGVSSCEELQMLAKSKLWGAILGRAMYEGKLSLKAALAAVDQGSDI